MSSSDSLPYPQITHARVFAIAGPIILSNLSTPLLGLVDTAVVGHLDSEAYLGAIAIGAMIFSFLYWGFGFLRMGTTALTAQAHGIGNGSEVRSTLARAFILSVGLGLAVIAFQSPVSSAAFYVLEGSDKVERLSQDYFFIRIWSAPATLINYAILGWLLGLGRARTGLALQIFLNGVNIVLDLVFVIGFGWDVKGVAAGTLIAEIAAAILGLYLVARILSADGERFEFSAIREMAPLVRMLAINRDIFIRTLCLIFAFSWFTAQSAAYGDLVLAANAILMQFSSLTASGLDGFATAAEVLVGNATGRRNRAELKKAVIISTQWAGGLSLLIAAIYLVAGEGMIALMTSIEPVRASALVYLPWLIISPLVSIWCYQLDGIFIGATRTADMRNAMVVSLAGYMALYYWLTPLYGNHGLWAAISGFFILRGLTLVVRYPALARAVTD